MKGKAHPQWIHKQYKSTSEIHCVTVRRYLKLPIRYIFRDNCRLKVYIRIKKSVRQDR